MRTYREHAANQDKQNLPVGPLMFLNRQTAPDEDRDLDAAVDEAIAACDGDLRATIRALIVANKFLECEVGELMKSISHAYTRGRFRTYSG
jgi:hypothetical protein